MGLGGFIASLHNHNEEETNLLFTDHTLSEWAQQQHRAPQITVDAYSVHTFLVRGYLNLITLICIKF